MSKLNEVAIIHFGEGLPSDVGYRPGRYGRLAEHLTAEGFQVVRIAPSFRHDARTFRSQDDSVTAEGRSRVVSTRGYANNRGLDRLRFFFDFVRGTAQVVREERPEVIIASVPPPSMLMALRRAAGRDATILADIRDLWPDVVFPSPEGLRRIVVLVLGRAAALDMYASDGVVALSNEMLRRAPVSRRSAVIPIGIDEQVVDPGRQAPTGPLKICFLGNIGFGLDFEPLLAALDRLEQDWEFDVFGRGPRADEIHQRLAMLERAEFRGQLEAALVPETLARYDIGVVPRVNGFGSCMSNKVFEYLGCGLSVFFRLEPGVGAELEEHGLGVACTVEDDWYTALSEFGASLDEHRRSRQVRIASAVRLYSGDRVHGRFSDVVNQLRSPN